MLSREILIPELEGTGLVETFTKAPPRDIACLVGQVTPEIITSALGSSVSLAKDRKTICWDNSDTSLAIGTMPDGKLGIGIRNNDFCWDYEGSEGNLKVVGRPGDLIKICQGEIEILNKQNADHANYLNAPINSHKIHTDGIVEETVVDQTVIDREIQIMEASASGIPEYPNSWDYDYQV
jgi:hypothetical protein